MDEDHVAHTQNFANNVSHLCFDKFKALPKTGKPQPKKEWTLLAGIIISNQSDKKSKVVALSTGTKCLGFSQLTEDGNVVFDSHAEILARRALIRYIYYQMSLVLDNKQSDVLVFDECDSKFQIKPEITFHLFISHVPCGDAAIFPKQLSKKHSLSSDDSVGQESVKRMKLEHTAISIKELPDGSQCSEFPTPDIYRFLPSDNERAKGAKCVESGDQDPKEAGENFHVTGVLRTKPGRGDPTWSMSCSDKIALWNVCGLQGALLSHCLSKPLYLSSVVFGKCPFNKAAVERAITQRILKVKNLPPIFKVNQPEILQSDISFEFCKENVMKENKNATPCSSSVIWCDIPNFLNVSVNGRKQGITKKNLNKPTSRLDVCKSVLFEKFLGLVSKDPLKILNLYPKDNTKSYLDYKLMAENYQNTKKAFLEVFDGWKKKPDHFQKFICQEFKTTH